jgi:hypothetical protein
MSILSYSLLSSTVSSSEPCWKCGTPVPSDHTADPLHCQSCNRLTAELALHEAASTLRALRNGIAPFDLLTCDERAEHFASLMGDGSPDSIERAAIEQSADHAHLDLAEFVGYVA